jgi:hypothetical protein
MQHYPKYLPLKAILKVTYKLGYWRGVIGAKKLLRGK